MRPLSAADALDRYFLEARARLLDLAAILDRIERGDSVPSDPRLARIREALTILQGTGTDRAERIQQVFSLAYEATWERPKPRG
jgi:hypothetical protein